MIWQLRKNCLNNSKNFLNQAEERRQHEMNRRLKWLLTLLSSNILIIEALLLAKLGIEVMQYSSFIGGYLGVGSPFTPYANMVFIQSINLIILAITIPLIVWWNENGSI